VVCRVGLTDRAIRRHAFFGMAEMPASTISPGVTMRPWRMTATLSGLARNHPQHNLSDGGDMLVGYIRAQRATAVRPWRRSVTLCLPPGLIPTASTRISPTGTTTTPALPLVLRLCSTKKDLGEDHV
jgi:hypothetical protein